MNDRPLILVSACVHANGFELNDRSLSLATAYQDALIRAGGLPVVLPCTSDPELIAQAVARADGVMLTGGDDLVPEYYASDLPPPLRAKIRTEDAQRDACEFALVTEAFRQPRPLLAICRGMQIINVALGGSLIVDIPSQCPSSTIHNRIDVPREPVHEVEIAPASMLQKIAGGNRLDVNSTHHQALDRIAPPLKVVARAPDGVVEAIELLAPDPAAPPFLLGLQFHPDRLAQHHPQHQAIFNAFIAAAAARRRSDGELIPPTMPPTIPPWLEETCSTHPT